MIDAVEMRAPEGALVLEIDWADGVTHRFPHVVLRGFCPCAHCQGHQGPVQWAGDVEGSGLTISSLEEVGNYAVRLGWGDGHATGIYSFRYLRELGAVASHPLEALRGARFAR